MRFLILILFSIVFFFSCERKPVGSTNEKNKQIQILTKDEICSLLDYDQDGQIGYLIRKGFKQDTNFQSSIVFDGSKAMVSRDGKVKFILLPGGQLYNIWFRPEASNEYKQFLNQFPEIKSPFPTLKEKNNSLGTNQKLSENCFLIAMGFISNFNSYVIKINQLNG